MAILATEEYLKEHGEPKTPEELQNNHKHIEFSKRLPNRGEWNYVGPEGEGKIKINEIFATQNGQALCFAAEKGIGITCLPRYICQPLIDSGEIIEIMKDYEFNGGPRHICHIPA